MLLTEYAIKWWFVISPFLTDVLHYLGKHEPGKLSFRSCWVYIVWSDVTYLWSQCDRHFV